MAKGTPTAPAQEVAPERVGDESMESMMRAFIKHVDERMTAIEGRIEQQAREAAAPPKLRLARKTEDRVKELKGRLRKAGDAGSITNSVDMLHPNAHKDGFQPDDIVRLKRGTHVEKAARKYLKLPDTEDIYGEVHGLMYVKRDGLRKYKVHIPDFDDDGITEDELEWVST